MSENVLRNLLDNEGIDTFIRDIQIEIKDSYLYLLESYRKIHGIPKDSSAIHSPLWEILRIYPEMNGIFFALDAKYLPFHEKAYFANPVAQEIISMVMEMLRINFPGEI